MNYGQMVNGWQSALNRQNPQPQQEPPAWRPFVSFSPTSRLHAINSGIDLMGSTPAGGVQAEPPSRTPYSRIMAGFGARPGATAGGYRAVMGGGFNPQYGFRSPWGGGGGGGYQMQSMASVNPMMYGFGR